MFRDSKSDERAMNDRHAGWPLTGVGDGSV
jgi:hypothetical protein